jgi:hypothetical protein
MCNLWYIIGSEVYGEFASNSHDSIEICRSTYIRQPVTERCLIYIHLYFSTCNKTILFDTVDCIDQILPDRNHKIRNLKANQSITNRKWLSHQILLIIIKRRKVKWMSL